MTYKKYPQNLLSSNTINLAIIGDENALSELFKHYSSLIRKHCTKKYYDINGNSYLYFDEDKEQKLKEHIVTAVKHYRF